MFVKRQILTLVDYQFWFMRRYVLSISVFLLFFGGAIDLWYQMIINQLLPIVQATDPKTASLVETQISKTLWIIFGFASVLVVVAAIQSFVVSKRVAGPVFSITRQLENISTSKKWNPIRLRKNDLFQKLATALNRMGKALFEGQNS